MSIEAPRLARLALHVPDAGSSGLIDITDLHAEPPPLSLAASLVAAPRRGTGRGAWPMIALGSVLALSVSFVAVAAALHLAPSTASSDAEARGGQLSMHDAANDRELHASLPAPLEAHSRATATADLEDERSASEDLAAPTDTEDDDELSLSESASAPAELSEPAPAKPKPKPKPRAKPSSSAKSPAKAPSAPASPASKPKPKTSVSVECVLDPARCDLGSPAKASTSTTDSRPAPRPAKLSTSQLKAALATTKADARRCGPEHGADTGSTVRVKLSIEGATGSVSSATAQGDDANTPLGVCVARALGQTEFPQFLAKSMGTIYSVRL